MLALPAWSCHKPVVPFLGRAPLDDVTEGEIASSRKPLIPHRHVSTARQGVSGLGWEAQDAALGFSRPSRASVTIRSSVERGHGAEVAVDRGWGEMPRRPCRSPAGEIAQV